MSPEQLTHPEWRGALVWLLLSAALALGLAHWRALRRRRRLLGPRARPAAREFAGDVALLVALASIGFALLGPVVGQRLRVVPTSGIDAVFVVDVSRSMDARDVPPSRLARARRALEELLARLHAGDRAALVAFAGRAALLAPLTPDSQALRELAAGLDSEFIRPAHSDLGAGLRAGLEAFEYGSERPRLMFVLSDGETASARDDLRAAATAARRQVRVLAAALGSDAGAEVPDRGAPLRDEAGRVVVSRRRSERLAELVAVADGELFVADEWGSFDFSRAAAALRRDAGATPGDAALRRVPAVRVVPFAAAAFALLLVEALPLWRGGRPRGMAPLGLALILVFSLGTAPGQPGGDVLGALEAAVRSRPRDARLLIELGIARLERGGQPAATRAFRAAAAYARDPELAGLAYYNLGVSELDQGELERARDAFFDALALVPGDSRARFNLEWTLRALAATPPPSAPPAPQEAEREQRDDARNAPEEPTRAAEAAPPPSLDPEQLRRILEQLPDDPARALRRGLRGEPDRRRQRPRPAW